MRENTAAEKTKSPTARRKKLALAASGTMAGVAGIAVLAAWSGTTLTETQFGAGTFGVEISTDGGTTWVDQAENGVSGSELEWFNAVSNAQVTGQENIYPYDKLETTVQLRLGEEVNRSVDLSAIESSITDGHGDIDIDWSLTGGFDGNATSAVQSAGTAVGGAAITDASFEDLTLANQDLVLAPGDVLTVTIDAEVGYEVEEDSVYGASWAFLADLSQPGN